MLSNWVHTMIIFAGTWIIGGCANFTNTLTATCCLSVTSEIDKPILIQFYLYKRWFDCQLCWAWFKTICLFFWRLSAVFRLWIDMKNFFKKYDYMFIYFYKINIQIWFPLNNICKITLNLYTESRWWCCKYNLHSELFIKYQQTYRVWAHWNRLVTNV